MPQRKFNLQDEVRSADLLMDNPNINVDRRFVAARRSGMVGSVYGFVPDADDVFWVKHKDLAEMAVYGADELELFSE